MSMVVAKSAKTMEKNSPAGSARSTASARSGKSTAKARSPTTVDPCRDTRHRRGVKTDRSADDIVTSIQSSLSNWDTMDWTKNSLMVIGGLAILKAVAALSFLVNFVVLPVSLVYALQTCPNDDSFDAKKELRRVLQGKYLPEDHPEKPKDWFSKAMAKVGATVGAQLAASTCGYQVSRYNVFGLCTFVTVRVPLVQKDVYWVGIFGRWKYVMQRDIPTTTGEAGRKSSI